MKFLTFVDVHEDHKTLKELVARATQPDIDFVVCAGDFSTMGHGVKIVFEIFQRVGKKFYVIPGNHEEQEGFLEAAARGFSQVVVFHKQAVPVEGYIFLGYGGGGFAQQDAEFRKIARGWYGEYQDEKIVLVTHMPPLETKIDLLHGRHVGSIDYRQFIERIKPKLVICGHLHETAGVVDIINGTKIVNPGWEGMVIEVK